MQQFLTSLLLAIYVVQEGSSIKCYFCGPGAFDPFRNPGSEVPKNFPRAQKCQEFQLDDSQDPIVECPLNYVGCITQINGTQTTRTCDTVALNDCQTANGVRYCLCSTDLCNRINDNSSSLLHRVGDPSHVQNETSSRDPTDNSVRSELDDSNDEKLHLPIKSSDAKNQSTQSRFPVECAIVIPWITMGFWSCVF